MKEKIKEKISIKKDDKKSLQEFVKVFKNLPLANEIFKDNDKFNNIKK